MCSGIARAPYVLSPIRPVRTRYAPGVHLRPPSIDHGLASGIWGVVLGLYVIFGGLAIGVGRAESFIVGALAAAAIFLYVRLYGQDEVRRPRRRPRQPSA